MDVKRAYSKKQIKEGYVFQKTIQLTTPVSYTFIIWKKKLLVIKMSIVNFQNMMDMQKDHAYKFSNFVALKKLIRIQSNLSKQNQHEQNPKLNNLWDN